MIMMLGRVVGRVVGLVVVAFFASVGILASIAGRQAPETVLAAAGAALAVIVGEAIRLAASPALSASPTPTAECPNPTTILDSREIPIPGFLCDSCDMEKREQPLLREYGYVCSDCDSAYASRKLTS